MTETMTFGVKTTEDTDTGGNGDYIHRFSKDGEYRLRFLEEYDQWTTYYEHFSAGKKTSYPCTGDRRSCPGCTNPDTDEAKASKKYLVNAVQQDPKSDKQGYAHLWKMPYASLKESLLRYREKSGDTLTDRDYTIIRYQSDAGQTRYSIDREDREPVDLSKFDLQDHQTALMTEYQEAWDTDARKAKEERLAAAKNKDTKKDEPQTKGFKVEETKEEEPEVPDALLSKEEREAKAAKPKVSIAKDPEPEPQEEVEVTPSSIRSMEAKQLVDLYKQAGFETELDGLNGSDRDALAENLIRLLSE